MLKKRFVSIFIKILVTLISLIYVSFIVNLSDLISMWQFLPLWLFGVVTINTFLHAWLSGTRWKCLNTDASTTLNSWQYFRYSMISKTFNVFMPGALGGDLARSILVYRNVPKNKGENVVSIFTDRIVGLFSIILLGLFACLFTNYLPNKSRYLSIYTVILTLFFSVFFIGYFVRKSLSYHLKKFGRVGCWILDITELLTKILCSLGKNKSKIFTALLISLPIHLLGFFTIYLTAYCMELDISFVNIVTISALVWFITAIPISISGLGVREISFIYLMGLVGISPEKATILSLYIFLFSVLGGLLGLLILLCPPSKANEPSIKMNEKAIFLEATQMTSLNGDEMCNLRKK